MSYKNSAKFYDLFDTKGNIKFYLELSKKTKGKVLELGMGTGRVLFEIAMLGREVVGIDNSPEMLEQARQKLKSSFPSIKEHCKLIEADMRTIEFKEFFGFIYSASSGLNLPKIKDTLKVIKIAERYLEKKGIFAFDLIPPHSLRKNTAGFVDKKELKDGQTIVRHISQSYKKDIDTTSVDIFYEIYDAHGKMVNKFHEFGELAVITPEMVKEMLNKTNLKIKSMYGDFEGGSYTDESKWLVFVVEK